MPSMMEPRTHGANRRAKYRADLRVRLVMKIAQDYDLAILDRDPRERSAYFGARLHRHQLFEWIGGTCVVDRFDAERGQREESSLTAQPISAHVSCDAVQVRAERGSLGHVALQ